MVAGLLDRSTLGSAGGVPSFGITFPYWNEDPNERSNYAAAPEQEP
jgi:hypothetical protein